MTETKVLIIGGGPAGSVCGSLFLKAGIGCVVVDHAVFPRDKICGGGLSPKAWKLLEHLLPDVRYDYHAVKHLRLLLDGKQCCEFDSEMEIRITKRRELDNTLLNYYLSKGGGFRKDSPARIEELADGHIVVTMKSGEQVLCEYLIGADGSNSFVRRHLTGRSDKGIIAMEQYMEGGAFDSTNDIVVGLSRQYDRGGYFFRMPNGTHDVVGFGDNSTTPARFRQVMNDMHIPVGKIRGAYIYLSNDYPLHEHMILIGDAGGFANRLSCEGLYDAFKTAYHAVEAITENRPFSETNRDVFRKMKKEVIFSRLFVSAAGFFLLRLMCHFPNAVKWCFDTKMKRESFFRG